MLEYLVIFGAVFGRSIALDNGLALTPPMGWMSWERYRCVTDCKNYPDECISEGLFKRAADLIVSEGYADVGYEYIVIDDCWLNKTRDENGRLQPDKDRFPNGIKALADYVHSKGLKFGIYEDYGTHTCAGYPGIIDHMEIDAQTFAEWEIDYLKLDGCYVNYTLMSFGYPEFGRLLNQTGRPIVYSCSWPAYVEPLGIEGDYETLTQHCNLWRNWDDIDDSWKSVTSIMTFFGDNQDRFSSYAGPGHWNDPDMLIIGNFGLSYDQSKAQMALWAIMAAPLFISTDLKAVRPEYKAILQNKKVIAVNQDPLGYQGRRIKKKWKLEVWTKPMLPIINDYHTYAIAVVSHRMDGRPIHTNFTFATVGLNNPEGYIVEDLFATENSDLGLLTEYVKFAINPSGVVMFRATPFVAPVTTMV